MRGKFNFVGVSVAMLEEMCHLEWFSGFQKLKLDPVSPLFSVA